jgi:hypothetical protein
VHSPEICLPGSGWEIAWLERTDIASEMGTETPFNINRAIIQHGETRMMVYYWFQQGERRIAWDFAAKFYLMVDGITHRFHRRGAGAADDADPAPEIPMIVSSKHDFAFVHIPKCAGSTIRHPLRDKDDFGGRFYRSIEVPGLGLVNANHLPLNILQEHFPTLSRPCAG